MFHESHHPFGEEHYRQQRPVQYYNAVYKHVFSHLAVELDKHQTSLQLFRPNTAVSFVSDSMRWGDIFEEIALITGKPTPEAVTQAFLDKPYTHDPTCYFRSIKSR